MKGVFHRLRSSARRVVAAILSEGLAPGRAAAAVFIGVFIGIVPIYGFQALTAVGLAVLFRLNKPLTLAATFISNPFFQPFLVAVSIGLGHLVLNGHYQVITESPFTAHGFTSSLAAWFAGSVILGAVLGGLRSRGAGARAFAGFAACTPPARQSTAALSGGNCGWTACSIFWRRRTRAPAR